MFDGKESTRERKLRRKTDLTEREKSRTLYGSKEVFRVYGSISTQVNKKEIIKQVSK